MHFTCMDIANKMAPAVSENFTSRQVFEKKGG